jgi:hypothetical protein
MSVMDAEFEWLSTHPSNETRQLVLDTLMPTAIQLREKCKVRPVGRNKSRIITVIDKTSGFSCFQ